MQVLDQSTTKICSAKISVLKVDDANGNIAFICQRFYGLFLLEVDEENKKLSNICWKPKLRKHSSKATFIIVALQCFVKTLSKAPTAALTNRLTHLCLKK